MNRQEFIYELERLLQVIPDKDRIEAIQYYQDYFEDAGIENEQNVIRELQTPERVAAIIQEDLRNDNLTQEGEFTERGYRNPNYDELNKEAVVKVENPSYSQNNNYSNANGTNNYYNNSSSNNAYGNNATSGSSQYNNGNQGTKEPEYVYEYTKIPKALLIIGAIFFIPVGIPLICSAFGLVIAFLSVIFALLVTFGALAFGLTLGGVVTVVAGLTKLFTFPMLSFLFCGSGLLLIGIGLLFVILTVFSAKLVPMMFKGIINICKLPFRRRVMA